MGNWVIHNGRWVQTNAIEQGICNEPSGKPKIAVCVTCHLAYAENGWLDECCSSIENQQARSADLKILCLDNMREWFDSNAQRFRRDWTPVHGDWGYAVIPRNMAWNMAKEAGCEWIWYMDADNTATRQLLRTMAEQAEAASANTAIIYPSIRVMSHDMRVCKEVIHATDYPPERLRRRNYIDTASLWRIEALESVGGWDTDLTCLDDWSVACRMNKLGWRAIPGGVSEHLNYRQHAGSRLTEDQPKLGDIKSHYRALWFDVVSLVCGREFLSEWFDNMGMLAWPAHTRFWIVDDTASGEDDRVEYWCGILRACTGHPVTILTSEGLPKYSGSFATEYDRQNRVAQLYNLVLPYLSGDRIVLVEDDVFPPQDAVMRLLEGMRLGSQTAAVSAVYPVPNQLDIAIASLSTENWNRKPRISKMAPGTMEVGMGGGGCTLYDRDAVRECLPVRVTVDEKKRPWGWDTTLSRDLRALGMKVKLHCDVRCEHRKSMLRRRTL